VSIFTVTASDRIKREVKILLKYFTKTFQQDKMMSALVEWREEQGEALKFEEVISGILGYFALVC
jgi:hypothetical protein